MIYPTPEIVYWPSGSRTRVERAQDRPGCVRYERVHAGRDQRRYLVRGIHGPGPNLATVGAGPVSPLSGDQLPQETLAPQLVMELTLEIERLPSKAQSADVRAPHLHGHESIGSKRSSDPTFQVRIP